MNMRKARRLSSEALFCLLAAAGTAATARADPPSMSSVALYQSWTDEQTADGQCEGRKGEFATAFGEFSEAIKFNTDSRPGGCAYRLALIDPDGALAARGWSLTVTFSPQGDAGQCKYPGRREVPIVPSIEGAATAWSSAGWADAIVIDTDYRVGGCILEFQVNAPKGIDSPKLDVSYEADGDAGQCPRAGMRTATADRPAAMIIDTDDRPGGCKFRMRLRD
jgi:hypothetical protein